MPYFLTALNAPRNQLDDGAGGEEGGDAAAGTVFSVTLVNFCDDDDEFFALSRRVELSASLRVVMVVKGEIFPLSYGMYWMERMRGGHPPTKTDCSLLATPVRDPT
jgi:hypothetical protein